MTLLWCSEVKLKTSKLKGNMTSTRKQLEAALESYVSDTFDYIRTVKGFVDVSDKWEKTRKEEIETIERIKTDEADDSDDKDLKDLTDILVQVRSGLREMQGFLDALEKLAVTSVLVFEDKPKKRIALRGSDLESVRNILLIAKISSPLPLFFKRNNEAFFQPKLENMEVLMVELEKYIVTIHLMCDIWKRSSLTKRSLNPPVVEVRRNQSEAAMGEMLSNINMIDRIRMDEDFRMKRVFLGRDQTFITEFSKRKAEMLKFLQELEACADNLDEMCKASNIAGTVNSSVGIASGTLSILGLVFAPLTAGLSLGLTAVGTGLGVASGVSSVVTSATEIGVNETQAKKAEKNFQNFVEDSNVIQSCLDDVVEKHFKDLQKRDIKLDVKRLLTVGGVAKGLRKSVKHLKNIKAFRAGNLAPKAVGKGLFFAGKLGKVAAGAAGALFIGVDIYSIVQHSKHLRDGCETQTSKWIRARVALWRVEIDSWQRICDSLNRAQQDYEKNKEFLKIGLTVSRSISELGCASCVYLACCSSPKCAQ